MEKKFFNFKNSFWSRQKILITGSKGFVGQNLVEKFKDVKKVTILTPTKKQLNLLNPKSVENICKRASCDV